MEPVKKSRRLIRPCKQQQHLILPEELIQYIQSLLPVKEATRTGVLSKSWLRAWSTIPTLRFPHQSNPNYIKWINRTLQSYHRENIPIVTFDLHFDVHDQIAVSLTDKWLSQVASKTCLKELYLKLSLRKYSYTLPDDIFSCENLNTISVKHECRHVTSTSTGLLRISNNKNVVINCVNLRVIELLELHISEGLLHKLFSTCTLLEKISLSFYNKYKSLEVKSLRYLRELRITPYAGKGILELYDLPSLDLFFFDSSIILTSKRLWFNKDSLGSLRKLFLAGVVIDNAFCDIFKSNFPFLEILSLDIECCKLKILDFTCASLQRLDIELQEKEKIDIRFCAPRLRFFRYTGEAIPNLSFPAVDPDQIVLDLKLTYPVDYSFFIKIRETLNSFSNFEIKIVSMESCIKLPFNLIDDIRTNVMSPATNVQKLTFHTHFFSTPLPFLDAFFLICHPKYVKAGNSVMIPRLTDYLRNLIAKREVEEETRKDYWPDLKGVEVENRVVGKCGALTSSWTNLLDEPTYHYFMLFRLAWPSQ